VTAKLITDLKKYFVFSVALSIEESDHILVMNDEFGNIFKGMALICITSIPKFACKKHQKTKSLQENCCFPGLKSETKLTE